MCARSSPLLGGGTLVMAAAGTATNAGLPRLAASFGMAWARTSRVIVTLLGAGAAGAGSGETDRRLPLSGAVELRSASSPSSSRVARLSSHPHAGTNEQAPLSDEPARQWSRPSLGFDRQHFRALPLFAHSQAKIIRSPRSCRPWPATRSRDHRYAHAGNRGTRPDRPAFIIRHESGMAEEGRMRAPYGGDGLLGPVKRAERRSDCGDWPNARTNARRIRS